MDKTRPTCRQGLRVNAHTTRGGCLFDHASQPEEIGNQPATSAMLRIEQLGMKLGPVEQLVDPFSGLHRSFSDRGQNVEPLRRLFNLPVVRFEEHRFLAQAVEKRVGF